MSLHDYPHEARIVALLAQIQQQGPVTDLVDLKRRYQERQELEGHLKALANYLQLARQSMQGLRKLPHLDLVYWAQAVLALPNLAFFEVDTSGLGPDAEVLRVLLLNQKGDVLFDTCIQPAKPPSPQALYTNGLNIERDLAHALPPQAVWASIEDALIGKYLLFFNQEFDLKALAALAARLNQPDPVCIGACLMQQSMSYFQMSTYPKLSTLCSRLGKPLPEPPQQNALHRATGQLHLLEAMAQGISERVTISDEDEDEDDDHPF
jgi:hypothetical protein